MMRKFAVALIATTMLVAPALAADKATSTPAAPVAAATSPAVTSAPATASKTKTHKTMKVAHRHSVHHMFAKNHSGHVKTAKVSKPVAPTTTVGAATTPASTTPAAGVSGTPTPAAATVSKPAVKTVKAGAGSKKIKIAHHHNGHKLAATKTFKHGSLKHGSHVKTAKVSKPVKHGNAAKAHTPATHEAKNAKVIAN